MSKPDPTELLPCPFCGGAATYDYDDDGWNWIVCRQCGVSTNASTHCGEDCRPKLAEVWNRRAVPALVQPEPSEQAHFNEAEWHDAVWAAMRDLALREGDLVKPMNIHTVRRFCEASYAALVARLAASPSASQPEPSDGGQQQ